MTPCMGIDSIYHLYVQIGECVNAMCDNKKYYSAFISFNNPDGTYNVYFVGDGTTRDNVPYHEIKRPIMRGGKASADAHSYCGRVFYDEGDENFAAGEFKVLELTRENNFICQRVKLNDDDGSEVEEFDISYTINRINKYEEE